MNQIMLDVNGESRQKNAGQAESAIKTGMPILYCGERYEIVGIDEYKKQIALYNGKLGLRVTCEMDSPHLRKIEETEKEKK